MEGFAPHRIVDVLTERFAPLETEFARAYWESQVESGPETDQRRARLELEVRRAKGDTNALRAVEQALAQAIHEPLLQRQLEVLRLSMAGNQMDEDLRARIVELAAEIESDFASYRPHIDGRSVNDNDIEVVLRSSDDDDERRRVWLASKEIGGVVAERVRELVRLRNKAARDLGFADHYRKALSLQEIDEAWLFDLLDELDVLTAPAFAAWKQRLDEGLERRLGVQAVYPWHYADPFFQQLPPEGRIDLDGLLGDADAAGLAAATFGQLGIDLSGVMEVSDLRPRKRKSQHAFCIDIDRGGKDVRILANIAPGERWCEVMLHECGHAAYDISLDRRLPYVLRRAAHTFTTEAIAIMFGRLVRDPHWLTEVVGIDRSEIDPLVGQLKRAEAAQSLVFARWALVMTHFERALYSDPEGDLDSLWWNLVERFQMVARPPRRSHPDWAAKVHIAAAPVYYHNYMLGEVLASQIKAVIDHECGAVVGSRDAGDLLRERIFKPGASLRWDALIEHATGKPLSSVDFAGAASI